MEADEEVIAYTNLTLRKLRSATTYQFLDPQPHGGNKAMEQPAYIGAFDGLDLDELLRFLVTYAWAEPEHVQLFVCEENEDLYRERFQPARRMAIASHA